MSDFLITDDCVSAEDACRLMLSAQPWIDLKYTADNCKILVNSVTDGPCYCLLAKIGDQVVGFAVGQPGFLLGHYLKTIVVDPDYQGQGIGKKLLAEFEARSFANSLNAYLCVSDFNHQAQNVYKSQGYEMVGKLENLIVAGHSELLMRKTTGPLQSSPS